MGSQFKAAALEEHTAKAIRKWHQDVKQKRKQSNHHQYPNDLDPSQHQEGSSPFVAGRLSSMVFESSSKAQSSQEMTPFHHRAPTFSELNYLDIVSNEIVEEPTETAAIKDESIVVDRSIGIKIGEISEVHEGETETHIT